LLPPGDPAPPAFEDGPVIARMGEIRRRMETLRPNIKDVYDDESSVGARLHILRRLLDEKSKREHPG
jgi:uncharacterized protein (UPF0335 family)